MFGFLKSALKPDKILDSAVRGIDALVFTDEEKSTAQKEAYKLWIEGQRILQGENSARSKTRRMLAVGFCSTFLLLLLSSAITAPINIDYAKFLLELMDRLDWAVGAIIIFYYGPYMVGRAIQSGKQTKNN